MTLNISAPHQVADSPNRKNSLWAPLQRWFLLTEAWAASIGDITELVVEVTGPGIPLPIRATEPVSGATGGQVISIVLDVPVGPERVFTVSALNVAGARIFQGQSAPLTLTAGQAGTANIQLADIAIRVTTTSLPGGTVDRAYSATVQAERASGTVTWVISQGTIPSGLSLNPSTGVIAGLPTTVGTFNFTVRATDSSALFDDQELSIVIAAQLTITTTTLPTGTVSALYSAQLQSAGGIGTVTWRLVSGSIPPGLTISQAGVISGVPTTADTFAFTIGASDTAGRTDSQALSITIAPPVTITTTELPDGVEGEAYNVTEGGSGFQLAASGGVSPYSWSISAGQLPGGLDLDSAGNLTGTLSSCGNFSPTFRVQDSNGASDEKALTIHCRPAG